MSLPRAPTDFRAPYDPNINIVVAAIYGAVPVTDTKLLATAALLHRQRADPASKYFYPVNGADGDARRAHPFVGAAARGSPAWARAAAQAPG